MYQQSIDTTLTRLGAFCWVAKLEGKINCSYNKAWLLYYSYRHSSEELGFVVMSNKVATVSSAHFLRAQTDCYTFSFWHNPLLNTQSSRHQPFWVPLLPYYSQTRG